MNDKIKNAFSSIKAEEKLKKDTLDKIMLNEKSKKLSFVFKLAPVMLAAVLIISASIYFTPVIYISIDINPSILLEINSFDRVIKVSAENEDAEDIVNSINVNNLTYSKAIEDIQNSEFFATYSDSYTEITVISNSEKKSEEIICNINNCEFIGENVYCYQAGTEIISQAAESGISVGKYRAYLEIQEVNSDIVIEDIVGLSMSAIRDLIRADDEEGNGSGQGNKYGKD